MRIKNLPVLAFFTLAAAASSACAHDAKPPQAPIAPVGIALTSAPRPKSDDRGAVTMSPDLRKACGIEDTGAAPKFDFDSALLGPTDRSELDQLAKCMTSGPLAGKSVELVGRADPRGEAEYNMNLGAIRANAVEHYLAQLGIAGSRFTTTSRGSLDSQGHDEATWAVDRRVDLRLAGQ
jgi:peptidoglycan-associated lipoprotein